MVVAFKDMTMFDCFMHENSEIAFESSSVVEAFWTNRGFLDEQGLFGRHVLPDPMRPYFQRDS